MSADLSLGAEALAGLALVTMAGSCLLVARVVVPRVTPHDPLLRAVAAVLLVLAQPIGICLALGAVWGLRLPLVVIAHLVLAATAVWRLGWPTWQVPAPAAHHRTATALVVGAVTSYVTLAAHLSLTGGRAREFDTQDYHLTNLATWLNSSHLWGLPFAQPGSVTATHPSNGELLGTWLALPTHGDELVYLVPLGFALLAILAMALLVRELRPAATWAPLAGAGAGLAVLLAPAYFVQVDSLLTDLVAAACVVTATALLLVARRAPSTATVVLAGAALGLGVGSKYTAAVPAAVVVVAGLVLLGSFRRTLWLLPGAVAFSAPWFVRNILVTGNPLFPQDLGVIDGSQTPYDVLNTTMLHHLVHGESTIVGSWARLGARFVGPVLLLVIAGVALALLRGWRARRSASVVLAGVVVVTFVGYLATPVTGGGPTGLEFIITSCFRYALVAVLLGAALGVAMLGWRIAAPALVLVVGWDVWRLLDQPLLGRPEVDLGPRHVAAALAAGVLAGLVVGAGDLRPTNRAAAARRPIVVGVAVVVALVGTVAVIHHNDRGRGMTDLESLVLAYGSTTPAVPVGVTDLRALLGPRLERPLIRVSRGGAAEEIPFADEHQLRRRVLGDVDAPPPPAELSDELDAAIDATGAPLLAVGLTSPLGFPDGWIPDDGWCAAGGGADGALFVRPDLLPPGAQCTTAAQLTAAPGRSA